jgi:hypothetical protein
MKIRLSVVAFVLGGLAAGCGSTSETNDAGSGPNNQDGAGTPDVSIGPDASSDQSAIGTDASSDQSADVSGDMGGQDAGTAGAKDAGACPSSQPTRGSLCSYSQLGMTCVYHGAAADSSCTCSAGDLIVLWNCR